MVYKPQPPPQGHRHTFQNMSSDVAPRYEKLPTGSLFPAQVDLDDLQSLLLAEITTGYTLDSDGSKRVIMFTNKMKKRAVYTPIPIHYEHLVRRFLWRIDALDKVFRKCPKINGKDITEDVYFAVCSNLRYTLDVLKLCRPAFREAVAQLTEVRIPFFDAYMLEEHYVGRHEPSAVILWQRDHPEHNLRTADVFALGELPSMISVVAWIDHLVVFRLDVSKVALWAGMGG